MLSCMIMHDACLFQSGSYEKDQNAFWDSLPDRNSCCQGTIWHPKTIMIHPTSLWKSIRNQKLGCLCGFVEPVRHFKITFSCHARLQLASKTQVPTLMSFQGVRCVRPWSYSCITWVSHASTVVPLPNNFWSSLSSLNLLKTYFFICLQ